MKEATKLNILLSRSHLNTIFQQAIETGLDNADVEMPALLREKISIILLKSLNNFDEKKPDFLFISRVLGHFKIDLENATLSSEVGDRNEKIIKSIRKEVLKLV
tara:strand:- start:517 stop:828 length:312 start_codon:yes stop_codon:yes gene_type:complete